MIAYFVPLLLAFSSSELFSVKKMAWLAVGEMK
jgi:hypothetical protein